MVTLLPEESEALKVFESLGLTVHRLPPGSFKTPEFLVDGDARGYAVEVKARHDSAEWRRVLRRGEVASQERSLGYGRWAEDVAHAALKQLWSADPQHGRWWILWLSIKCQAGADAMLDEAVGSLFGVRQVAYHDATSQRDVMRDCLFAVPGVFERHHQIVASVVATSRAFAFCVNELATDYGSFQSSALYLSFASIHPPISATDLTSNRGFFQIGDLSLDRRDDRVLTSYLERTYGLSKAVMLDMSMHSASMIVASRPTTTATGDTTQVPNEGMQAAAQKSGGG